MRRVQQIKLEAHALQSSQGSKCKSDKPRHRSAHWRKTNSFNSRPVRRGLQYVYGQGFDAEYTVRSVQSIESERLYPGALQISTGVYMPVYLAKHSCSIYRYEEDKCASSMYASIHVCQCSSTPCTSILTRPGCG